MRIMPNMPKNMKSDRENIEICMPLMCSSNDMCSEVSFNFSERYIRMLAIFLFYSAIAIEFVLPDLRYL